MSFTVMRDRDIRDALAHDRDFEQAGFNALLRE
jgi:predicted nucleic acid-binding protein